jgi:catechol 2,3-dioxygenase-like lactoylglutathione lyase family enzyme
MPGNRVSAQAPQSPATGPIAALAIWRQHSAERTLWAIGMFSHIFVGVSDFQRALAFYQPVLGAPGIEARFLDASRPWAGWQSQPGPRPLFLIGRPYDQQPHQPGNGQMVAFLAADRPAVRKAYAAALANGGVSEGAPGLRPEYHAHYYGAYFRDPDGNKLCVACHLAES